MCVGGGGVPACTGAVFLKSRNSHTHTHTHTVLILFCRESNYFSGLLGCFEKASMRTHALTQFLKFSGGYIPSWLTKIYSKAFFHHISVLSILFIYFAILLLPSEVLIGERISWERTKKNTKSVNKMVHLQFYPEQELIKMRKMWVGYPPPSKYTHTHTHKVVIPSQTHIHVS